ncbi:MAG TPA: arsenic resistance N-acetyltransferase ArsN2 [Chitinophagales bacterium]|nr:arsenic resistance N-acetyltransferase ArsN2 [Chitinophagales bacterium]HNM07775.1 arsenic resistance N-acetyltransferase ArsN2 [Chitinophagales bacterium]
MQISKAHSTDFANIHALLKANDLPVEGVNEVQGAYYLLKNGEKLMAVAGIEGSAPTALLRSVAVDVQMHNRGIGTQFMIDILSLANEQGFRQIYLLTETASKFYERLGFVIEDRSQAPESIRKSSEFETTCPSSATLMKYIIIK